MTSQIQIASFVEPAFGENAYVVWAAAKGPCWVIDPGLPPSAARVCEHIRKHELRLEAILLTHGHVDHIAGIPEILQSFEDIPVYIADEDKAALTEPQENLSTNIGPSLIIDVKETRGLPPASELKLADSTWNVIDTSGHSPGGRSFYCPAAGSVLVGDALFQLSIGRTDFHHSNTEQLLRNIRRHLFALPDETSVLSGHGPVTTIGQEKQFNPYLQA